MNALTQVPAVAAPRGFWVMIVDATGPLDTTYIPKASWRHHEQPVLEQLVRAAYPQLTVLAVEWAADPRQYTNSDDVLLVRVPGTHHVATLKPKPAPKPRKAVVEVDVAGPHDSYRPRHGYGELKADLAINAPKVFRVPAPPLDNVKVINTCATCGTAYTAATFAQLKSVGAKDVPEGGLIIHEDYRNCTCGSTRMVITTRIVGGK